VDAGGPYSANEGESVTLAATGADPDGTAVSFAWDLDNDNVFETPGQSVAFAAVDGSFSYPVQVQVTDASGATSVDGAVVNVANVAPAVGAIGGASSTANLAAPVAVSAAFTDPGVIDTHTAVWDWGDGSTSAGSVTEANGSGAVSGSHTYAAPGVYNITVTVTDKDGASASASRQQVVYAANGGFVVGAGVVNSPAGAYAAHPGATGRAVLSFLAQYPRRSATVPTGHVQFTLLSPRFSFGSRGFDWLVINGTEARLVGSGVVNGQGGYGFLLAVSDQRTVEKVRLKVWDKATGSVVYDTQPGAADNAAPELTLQGAAVVFDGALLGRSDAGAADEEFGITPRLYLPQLGR
jgi:PKD repeat protein